MGFGSIVTGFMFHVDVAALSQCGPAAVIWGKGKRVMRLVGMQIIALAAMLEMAALGLAASAAQAATDCPAQSPGVPGPFLVYFAVGSTRIDATGLAQIREAAARAKALYIRKVCLRGKADKQGNAQANFALSVRRAEAVAAALIRNGVDAGTVSVVGKGEAYGDSLTFLQNSQDDRSVRISLTR
jgi:OmpA family